ncbi:MAG: Ig-like domain-containing protein, partial [Gemmataceae bacterium]
NISITGSEAAYFPVLEVNPRKVNGFDEVLFGTNRVYGTRSTVWDPLSPVFSSTGRITALGIAPVSATGFYYAGTNEGQLWVAPTGGGLSLGTDWINRSAGLPSGLPITGITVAANNPNVAFVTVGGRTTGARIFRTNNAGRTWINVTANLPAGQVNDILLDNRAQLNAPAGKVYAATDSGVFVLVMGTSTWYRVGSIPASPVVDLSIDPTNNILSATVQGRGVFNLSVAGISPIANQFIDEDTVLGPIRFTLNALGTVNPVLNVSAVSSNQAVVRNSGIVIDGAGAVRTLTVRPVANASGETTITLRVNDGVRIFTTSFVLTVDAVNDLPTISPIADVALSLNQPSNNIPFTIGDVEDPATALTVTATSDNPALIPNGSIVLGGVGANRTIQFTPTVNTAGTARITVRVTDTQGGVGIRTFDVVVQNTTALPYSDDFNRPNNNFLGEVWTSPVGNFSLVNNAAQSTQRLSLAVLSGPVEQNVTVSADIALPVRSGQFAALVARYSGTGDRNMYIGGIQAAGGGTFNALIFRNLNGVWTQLVSRPVATGTGTLTFQVVDNSLKLLLNGSVVAFAFDNAITAGGTVGVRGNGAAGIRYDNFDAQVIVDVPPTPPFSDDFSAPVNGQLDPSLWREKVGNFRLDGNTAIGNTAGASLALLNPTFVSTFDATLEVDYTLGTGAFAGLVARSDAAGRNFYQAGVVRTGTGLLAAIYRVVNGVSTVLTSTAVTSTSGRLSFTLSGTTLALELDGNPLLSVNDSTFLNPGTVGIRGSGAVQFDNFFFDV